MDERKEGAWEFKDAPFLVSFIFIRVYITVGRACLWDVFLRLAVLADSLVSWIMALTFVHLLFFSHGDGDGRVSPVFFCCLSTRGVFLLSLQSLFSS